MADVTPIHVVNATGDSIGLAEYATGETIPVTNGGTGATTITGLVVGNGTSAMTAAVSGTDIKTINGTSVLGSGDIPLYSKAKSLFLAWS